MPKKKDEKKPLCFIIAPIGEPGSVERIHSTQMLDHVIRPVVEDECGYEVKRSDSINDPGLITRQIIKLLLEAPLVIADLAWLNPNVFYELAVRHAAHKPVIQLSPAGVPLPFDVKDIRTIQVDLHDLDSYQRCKSILREQIRAIERNPQAVENPISEAFSLLQQEKSGDPNVRASAEIMNALDILSGEVRSFAHSFKAGGDEVYRNVFDALSLRTFEPLGPYGVRHQQRSGVRHQQRSGPRTWELHGYNARRQRPISSSTTR